MTPQSPGIDATQLAAQRVAVKFLLRMRYPNITNNELEGFSALRQAISLFGQYAGTVKGDNAETRNSSLRQAACDFGLFRASIPMQLKPCNEEEQYVKWIRDENRQAALLAQGVAHALGGGDLDFSAAVSCFRELQDWPGSSETGYLRWQAAYNEAIAWRYQGFHSRAVLMLTELLGERAPDTRRGSTHGGVGREGDARPSEKDAIRYLRDWRDSPLSPYRLEDRLPCLRNRIQYSSTTPNN